MDEKKEPTLLQQRKKDLFFSPTNVATVWPWGGGGHPGLLRRL